MKKFIYFLFFLHFSPVSYSQISPTLDWGFSLSATENQRYSKIIKDTNGDFLVFGNYNGTVDFNPNGTSDIHSGTITNSFIQKVDNAGNVLWTKHLEANGLMVQINDAFLDGNNNIFITGVFQGTVDFNPGIAVNNLLADALDAFILKLDANGDFIFVKQITGDNGQYGLAITAGSNGEIYVAGRSNAFATDYDPGPSTFIPVGIALEHTYLLSLSPLGDFNWVKTIWANLIIPEDIAIDSNGDIVLGGTFSGTGDFDPNAGINNMQAFNNDGFLASYSSAGNFNWSRKIGGTVADALHSMQIVGNEIYSCGKFGSTVDFGNSQTGSVVTASGSSDGFVLKTDLNGNFIKVLQIGGSETDIANALYVENNSLVVCGEFMNTVNFDPLNSNTSLTSTAMIFSWNNFVLGLDTDLLFEWVGKVGSNGNDYLNDVTLSPTGPVVVGEYVNNCDIDPSATNVTLTHLGLGDAMIFKWNSCDENQIIPDIQNLPDLSFNCGDSINFQPPTATTDCGSVLNAVYSQPIPNAIGNHLIIWTFTSNNGAVLNQDQTIIILDTVPPIVNSIPNLYLSCNDSLNPPNPSIINATDACSSNLTYSFVSEVSDGNMCPETITRTYQVSDESGNTTSVEQHIIINDTIAPAASPLPDLILSCSFCIPAPDTSLVSAIDNCTTTPMVNWVSDISDNQIPETITRTYEIIDDCGNSSFLLQSIQISGANTITPIHTNLELIEASCELDSISPPSAVDNCGNIIIGTTNVNWPITLDMVVIWTFSSNGVTVIQEQDIVIQDINTTIISVGNALLVEESSYDSYQWYDCFTNQPIQGATTWYFAPTQPGDYYCSITDGNCSSNTDCTTVLKLDEQEQSNVHIYPNPTKKSISIDSDLNIYSIEVFGLNGELLMKAKEKIVNLENLPAGEYLLKITTEAGVHISSVVKM